MMKRQYLKSHYKDKKGFAFTMDVAMSIAIVLIILTIASFFAVKSTKDPLVNLHLSRVSSDFINLIEHRGYLDPLNEAEIEDYLEDNLPEQYSMYLEGYGQSGCGFEVGSEPADDKVVTSGKKFFMTNGNYCSLRYKIWLS